MTEIDVRAEVLNRVKNVVEQLKKELQVSHGVDAAIADQIHVSLNSDLVVVELPSEKKASAAKPSIKDSKLNG